MDPLDACGLLTAEQVGVVLGEAVAGSPLGLGTDGSNCQFVAADDQAPLALLTTLLETHYDDGFDEFLAEVQEGYSGTDEQVTVAGIDGYLIAGNSDGNFYTTCAALADGIVLAATMQDPAPGPGAGLQAQGLLAIALGTS